VRGGGRAAVLAALVVVVLVGLLGVPSPASAHGTLRRSEPAAGARLSTAPRELRLTFDEPVELAIARLTLLGPDGTVVALSPLRRGDSASVLVADVTGPLVAGGYTVEWQVAGRDGHPVRGRFRFTIAPGAAGLAAVSAPARPAAAGDGRMPAPPEDDADAVAAPGAAFDAESPGYAAVRWLGLAATLGVVGAVGFGLLVLPAARRGRPPAAWLDGAGHRLRVAGLAAGGALLLAAGLRLVAQSAALHGAAGALDPGALSALVGRTLWGTAWLLQAAAALLAMGGFALLPRRRAGWTFAVIAGVAAALSASLSGHAAAVPGRAPLAVAADALHVLAAGGWLGTLLVLAVAGLPVALRLAPGERGPAAAAMVNAFSPLALLCAAGVALTGVVAAWLHLGGLGALTTSAYGRTLLVKLAVLALVALAGAYNWRRVRPAVAEEGGARRLRRTAWAELAVGAVVLAVTAVLVGTPTPMAGAH
jgi:putative copper export protein/methionine-rich copper-binding protein CopC